MIIIAKLNKNQKNYLDLISGFHALTLKTISTKLKKSDSSARSTLKTLENNGFIESDNIPKGKYGTRMYWITKKAQKELGHRIKF